MNQNSILKVVPTKYMEQFLQDINLIVSFRNQFPDIWNAIPIYKINMCNLFNFSPFSDTILSYIRQYSTWTNFNLFLSHLSKQINKNKVDRACITIAKKNTELENVLKHYVSEFVAESNITVKYKTSILGGFMLDAGSIRIDASYANILSKLVGELNESFKS